MIFCVVLTNVTDVYVDSWVNNNRIYSAFNIFDKFVRNMYSSAWNILD